MNPGFHLVIGRWTWGFTWSGRGPRVPSSSGGGRRHTGPASAGAAGRGRRGHLGVVAHMPRSTGVVAPMPHGPAAVVRGLWPTGPERRGVGAAPPIRAPAD